MNISATFIRKPIATAMLMVAILLLGLIGYELLPVAALPNVDSPTIQVTAQLPGADAQTVASTVTTPLERQFGQIPGLTQMTSSSATEYAQITLQFDRSRTVDFGSAGRPGGDQCSGRPVAADDAQPADLSEDQPCRYAGADDGADLGDAAAHDGQRLREQHPGAEDIADARCRPGRGWRPAEPGDPGAGQPGAARSSGSRSGGSANGAGHGYGRSAEGHIVWRQSGLRSADQRSADDGARVQRLHPREPHRHLRRQRTGTRARCRPGDRRAPRCEFGRLDEHRAGHHHSGPAPVGRQRHRDRRQHQEGIAAARSLTAAVDQDPHRIGPHPDDPSQRRGCSKYAAADDRAGGRRHLSVSTQTVGDSDPGDIGADVAGRHFCCHLCARLQPRQPLADGAHDRGRLRRRRCYRHDREHCAPHRGREDPDGSRPARGGRNRLYDHVDLDFADRGVHPLVPDERHRRAVVPRVCRHCRSGDRRLGNRLADFDPNDVRPPPDRGGRNASWPRLARPRALLQRTCRGLRSRPDHRAAPPFHHAARDDFDRRPDRRTVHRDPQRLFSAARHGSDRRDRRGCTKQLSSGDEGPHAGGSCGRDEGPRSRRGERLYRTGRPDGYRE